MRGSDVVSSTLWRVQKKRMDTKPIVKRSMHMRLLKLLLHSTVTHKSQWRRLSKNKASTSYRIGIRFLMDSDKHRPMHL